MKIAIDIDEVIVKFIDRYLEVAKSRGCKSVLYEDVFTYNLWEVLGIKKEVMFDIMEEYNLMGYYRDVNFVEGARNGVKFLRDNYDVYFITSRPKSISRVTRDLIFNEFGVLGDRVIFSGDVLGGAKNKDEICRDLGMGVIIEDSEDESLGYAKNGLRVLLLDKPWNRSVEHENVRRCRDWGEILERVEEVANEKVF
jgi:uncharacterized HAD superfamily protein